MSKIHYTDDGFEPGIEARQIKSIIWDVKYPKGRGRTHRSVLERTGFITGCGKTFDPKLVVARPGRSIYAPVLPTNPCRMCYKHG